MKSKLMMKIEGGACSDVIAWNLELDEGLGEPYRAVVTTASEKVRTPADLKAQALGKRVVVTVEQYFESGLVTRHLNGIVTAVRHEGPASMRPEWLAQFSSEKPKGSLYAFVIEPTLVGLKQARRTQDYPDTTPLKAVQSVLARHNVSAIVDGAHVDAEAYSGKVRFVQNDETDWEFLHRILARYGLGEGEKGNFAVTFDAMDFSDDAERRWVMPAQPLWRLRRFRSSMRRVVATA